MSLVLLNPREFERALIEPNWADANGGVALAVDLRDGGVLPRGTGDWARAQAVPVIGLGAEPPELDLWARSEADLAALTERITRRPRASLVLVQVLRNAASLPPAGALQLESLAYGLLQSGAEYADWLNHRTPRTSRVPDRPLVEMAREGDVLRIELNSPENRNALSAPLRDELTEALRLVAQDGRLSAVLSGRGPVFSAGGDLSEFGVVVDPSFAHEIRQLRMPAQTLAQCAERVEARVHGACVGAGIELSAFAGKLIADPSTTFRLPEIEMGLVPGAGGCVSIPARIGRQRAAWLAITGSEMTARQALEWGLVDELRER